VSFPIVPQCRIGYKGSVGVFRVPVKVRNWQNRYLPPDRRGEEVQCDALVDAGAAEFALPVDMLERLRLERLGDVPVYTADGTDASFNAAACRSLLAWLYYGLISG
jgi:hypothetical protein